MKTKVFCISIALSLCFVLPLWATTPIDPTQTNVINNRFTISWVTDTEETAEIRYGTTPALGQVLGHINTTKTHHLTVTTGISADTQYYYEIVSGGQVYNNGGAPFTITTGPVLTPPAGSHIAYGQVFLSSGDPAANAIVILKLQDNDGAGSTGTSQPLSVVTDANGWWNLDLNNVRVQDLSEYFVFSSPGDNEIISFRIDENPPTVVTIDTSEDNPAADVTLGWVLNMQEMPWHENEEDYYTGAATCKMILDYIRDGAGVSLVSQSDIYNYAHPAADSLDMTPDEMDLALGHFDPYDTLVSNSYDTYDSTPDGNPYQGYNYTIDTYDSAQAGSLNEYMRDICHWMAFTVTQEAWWLKGDLVARPNTPAAVPIFGDTEGYNHWVAIKGAATTNNPNPDPLNNPWNTPDFTIYGFWMKDPLVAGGIGENKYATVDECINTYFRPLSTSDEYDGMYLQIAEPPAEPSTAHANLAKPTPQISNIEEVKMVRGEIQSGASAMSMQAMALGAISGTTSYTKPKRKDLHWRDIIDPHLLTDTEAIAAFEDTRPGRPILVYRIDVDDKDYYIIPYKKRIGRRLRTSAVIIIDAEEGYFKEASWTEEPIRYSIISRGTALRLVRNAMWDERKERYERILSRYKKRYGRRYRYIMKSLRRRFWRWFNYASKDTRLIWEPGEFSSSPYEPFWEVTLRNMTWYVTQDRSVYNIE